jgi:hypothetical protein
MLLVAMLVLIAGGARPVEAAPTEAAAFTYYYNMWGYEGIPTLGHVTGQIRGNPPPVEDYVDSHCRFIDLAPVNSGYTYLRYPLHLPNGVTITNISISVADYTSKGYLTGYFGSKPWASASEGTYAPSTSTIGAPEGQITMSITPLSVVVDNQANIYWVMITPNNTAADPDAGSLCVYGLQVTYTSNGAFLPLLQR